MSSFGNRFKRGGGHFSSAGGYEELDGESLMTEQEQVRRCFLSFCFRLSLSVPLTMMMMMTMMIKMSRRFSLRIIPIDINESIGVVLMNSLFADAQSSFLFRRRPFPRPTR